MEVMMAWNFFNSNPVMAYMYLCVKVTKALFDYSGLISLIFHSPTISWDIRLDESNYQSNNLGFV